MPCLPEASHQAFVWQTRQKSHQGPVLFAAACDEGPQLKLGPSGLRPCSRQPCPGRISLELLAGQLAGAEVQRAGHCHPTLFEKSGAKPPPYQLPMSLWRDLGQSMSDAWQNRICAALARLTGYRAAELADLFGVSPRRLERVFRRLFNQPPKAWLEYYRLAEYRRLFAASFSAGDMAGHLGFSHRNHLCRRMRQRGLRPPTA